MLYNCPSGKHPITRRPASGGRPSTSAPRSSQLQSTTAASTSSSKPQAPVSSSPASNNANYYRRTSYGQFPQQPYGHFTRQNAAQGASAVATSSKSQPPTHTTTEFPNSPWRNYIPETRPLRHSESKPNAPIIPTHPASPPKTSYSAKGSGTIQGPPQPVHTCEPPPTHAPQHGHPYWWPVGPKKPPPQLPQHKPAGKYGAQRNPQGF